MKEDAEVVGLQHVEEGGAELAFFREQRVMQLAIGCEQGGEDAEERHRTQRLSSGLGLE